MPEDAKKIQKIRNLSDYNGWDSPLYHKGQKWTVLIVAFNGLFLGGQVIKQLRTDFDVNIQLPKKSDTNDDSTIIITGYEKNANQARDAILKIINEFVSINLICCIILKTI